MSLQNFMCCTLIALTFCFCAVAPKPVPFSQTRALSAANPSLAAIEQQIATKKIEQDILEQRLFELEDKRSQSPKDESLKKQADRLEKENALCQAELAALIGRHQLESARLLKRADVADHEKAVAKLEETVKERRAALSGGR